jgi:hypothetical protein
VLIGEREREVKILTLEEAEAELPTLGGMSFASGNRDQKRPWTIWNKVGKHP